MDKALRLVIVCSLFLSLLAMPAAAVSATTCQTKAQGDADCNGTVDFIDYLYFIQEVNDIPMPPGVSADFNQDNRLDDLDRNVIVTAIGGTPQAFLNTVSRILASLLKFRI